MSVENTGLFHRFVRLCWSNADNIVSIAIAILAAYISAFGGKTDLAIAATATVLGILAFGAIRDRAARDELKRNTMTLRSLVEAQREAVSPDRFFARASSDCAALAGAESDLLVLQETARLIAETCRQDIVSLLQRGGKVRCMCALDSPEVVKMMALRNENLDEPYMLDRMRDGLRTLGVVAAEAKLFARNLEVRFLPYPPDITAIFKDAGHAIPGKRMGLVRLQGFQVTYSDKLDFASDGLQSPHVFELYRSQLEAMWRTSTKFVLLTGAPGIGKSTLLARIVEALRQFPSLSVDGFLTREMRDSLGQRVGFTTARIDGTYEELATKQQSGAYVLNRDTMSRIVLPALADALENRPDLLVIDEIGPIQLQDPRFKEAIDRLISRRDLSVLGIISPAGYAYVDEIQRHPRSGVVEVREDNRTELEHDLIAEFRPRPTLMH